MEIFNFETIDRNARANGTYDALTLDNNNDVSLNLLADGVTAVVICRNRGEIGRFEREAWSAGHWSDVDISFALEYVRAST